ncbi:MAG: peptidoglycan editing factor PgeF [Candidatus Omnitrophota bacterium]|jgi:hypothetical protein
MFHEAENNKGCYLFLPPYAEGLLSAFSARVSGNMSLSCGDTAGALNNRGNFLKRLGVDQSGLVCAKQAHGSSVSYICDTKRGRGAFSYDSALPDIDALITDRKNLPLSIFTADCLPVFLYDPKAPAIGLVHAGWRGSRENIAVKSVRMMQDRFDSKAEDLYAAFGPAIRGCCYEVGREFAGFFSPGYLAETAGHYYLDLARMNKEQLLGCGVKDKNIFDCGICTACRNEEFFSYRKEGSESGRMISVIMLK